MFLLKKISKSQIEKLSPKLKEEVLFVKDNTDNFDPFFLEAFDENDKRLDKLVQAELDALNKELNTPSVMKTTEKAQSKSEKPLVKKPNVEKSIIAKPKAEKQTIEKSKPTHNPSKTNAKSDASKTSKTKPKAVIKESSEPTFSHLQKVPEEILDQAQKVNLTCEFYTFQAEKDMEVEVKTKVKKGEHLLVHADGYLFAAITNYGFDKRCKKVKTTSKVSPQKETQKETPQKQNQPVLQKILDNPPAPLLTWLTGQIELWKNRKTNKKITKIMVVKESGDIIFEYTHYDKLLRVADLRYSYHKICPETTKVKKVSAPSRGSYRLLVKKAELKEQYSSNQNWDTCKAWIKEAYGCARAGNCTAEQKSLFKKYYEQCGDLVAK